MKSRCFYIKYDYIVLDFYLITAVYNCVTVIDKVRFKSVYYLEVGIFLVYLFNGIHSLGVCLGITVVGYGYCLMPPCMSLLYKHRRSCNCIHIRHICMHMKLYSFFGSIILLRFYLDKHYRLRIKAVAVQKIVRLITAVCKYLCAVLDKAVAVELCIINKQLHYHR